MNLQDRIKKIEQDYDIKKGVPACLGLVSVGIGALDVVYVFLNRTQFEYDSAQGLAAWAIGLGSAALFGYAVGRYHGLIQEENMAKQAVNPKI